MVSIDPVPFRRSMKWVLSLEFHYAIHHDSFHLWVRTELCVFPSNKYKNPKPPRVCIAVLRIFESPTLELNIDTTKLVEPKSWAGAQALGLKLQGYVLETSLTSA